MATPGTINYAYSPSDVVWALTTDSSGLIPVVEEAVVRDINISVTTLSVTTIEYDVIFSKNPGGSSTLEESKLFPDVDSALAALKVLLTA